VWASLALAASLCGCGAGLAPAFDARAPDNEPRRTAAALARMAAPTRAPGSDAPVLVAAARDGQRAEVLSFDLAAGRARWRAAVDTDTRPQPAGDAVVAMAQGALLVLDAASGAERFRAPLPLPTLRGVAAARGRIFVVVASPTFATGPVRSAVIALDARSGARLWSQELQGAAGRPALKGDVLLVPWQRQSLSLLDVRDGRELARVRSSDDSIDWVEADADGVRFGQRNVQQLAADYDGTRASTPTLALPIDGLPGEPPLRRSAFDEAVARRGASARVGLTLELARRGEQPALAHDRLYLVFYRHIFAFDGQGALRWTARRDSDVVATRSTSAGLLLAEQSGRVALLDAERGAERWHAQVQAELESGRFAVGGWAPVLAPTPPVLAPTPPPQNDALRRGLMRLALDADNRLVPARRYAIERLAALDTPEVTRDLLDVYRQGATPPELKRVIADVLRERQQGSEYLIDALHARYDFLDRTRPAPLAVIVPALVDARETRALPQLVERMLDHETPTAVLPTVVHAVVELGDASVVAPLAGFVRLYRADSALASVPEALVEAARGVLLHGGAEGAAMLEDVLADGRASAPVAAAITSLLEARDAPPATPTRVADSQPAQPLPPRLTQQMINATFAEHVDDVRRCVIDELGRNPQLAQVRIAFVAEADGSAHALSFVPNRPEFVDCLYPAVSGYRFPRVREARRVGRYVIAVDASEGDAGPAALPKHDAGEPFWAFQQRRALAAGTARDSEASREPWWYSRQLLAPLVEPSSPLDEAGAIHRETRESAATSAAQVAQAAASGRAAQPTPPANTRAGEDAAATPAGSATGDAEQPATTSGDTGDTPAPGARTPAAATGAARPPEASEPVPQPPAEDRWWEPAQ
jgi:outer membrane protein assembly factor BamB